MGAIVSFSENNFLYFPTSLDHFDIKHQICGHFFELSTRCPALFLAKHQICWHFPSYALYKVENTGNSFFFIEKCLFRKTLFLLFLIFLGHSYVAKINFKHFIVARKGSQIYCNSDEGCVGFLKKTLDLCKPTLAWFSEKNKTLQLCFGVSKTNQIIFAGKITFI